MNFPIVKISSFLVSDADLRGDFFKEKISVANLFSIVFAPKVLYDQLANTYGGLQKACHVYLL